MRNKKSFIIYIGLWVLTLVMLSLLLWLNVGDARVINYSGIVRGATQKLVKEEISGVEDDELIYKLDGIIYDLQTGKGDYNLSKNGDPEYQQMLADLKSVWEKIKTEIPNVRANITNTDTLFNLSQQHFTIADSMVLRAEKSSNEKLLFFIVVYFSVLLVSVVLFVLFDWRNRKALDKSAHYDSLTGILNRKGFELAANALLRRNMSDEFILAEFDINNFKSLNNAFGYATGDDILKYIATAITQWKKEDKLCARIDADDFVLLVKSSQINAGEIEGLLERIESEQPYLQNFNDVAFTIGAYKIDDNNEFIKAAMDKATTAHKSAKSNNTVGLVWYDAKLVKQIQTQREYVKRLNSALANQEFQLYLQPKINLQTMEIMGAEALVRWNIPDYGLVYPDSFIPLFEKNGSIAELDFYMLDKVCAYLYHLKELGIENFTISVNFSRATLCEMNLYERILATVEKYGIAHNSIEIEITESAINELADSVIQILNNLKTDGFLISMDDFGAGYSSLNMLIKLPIQIIKLDREFLNQIANNDKVKGVIASSVELAHALGMRIVCEGVELSEQAEFLKEIGCDYAQGYHFSKPIPNESFTDLII